MLVDVDNELKLRDHLDRDEKLLWVGAPRKGVIFRKADIFLIPFSILWCGFAVFWVIMASMTGGFFGLFGIPFVLVGLLLVFGRFIIDAKQREHTVYGITTGRIIIKSGVVRKTITSLDIRTLTNIEVREKGDGSGTIYLGMRNAVNRIPEGMEWWPGAKTLPSLNLIPDVRQVYRKIMDVQEKSRQREG